jgi:5'-nucleotidase
MYIKVAIMKILLTNDDGINAGGIKALFNAFKGSHEVYIIAPESERSACSNAITVRTQINIKRVVENQYSVSGYPADCVIIGLSGDFIPDVDLIIAGINHGPNVGDDLIFSGTVAGARTAYIFGKPAIAISIDSYHRESKYFNDAAEFLLGFVRDISRQILDHATMAQKHDGKLLAPPPFFNINYPDLPVDKIKGKKFTRIGRRLYRDSFQNTIFTSGQATVQMGGYIESIVSEGTDTTELEKGYISISPLMTDATNIEYFKHSEGNDTCQK